MLTKAPKGTNDILPDKVHIWQYIEDEIRKICKEYNFKEIRTPVFEHTELFERGVGDTTDVVEKEMYTFLDKGGRSITLRPEGTASASRSYIENGLFNTAQPSKLFYIIRCYRYEKNQAGRYREFNQFGAEVIGSQSPSVDAELMSLAMLLYERMGLKGLKLNINSIGCPECRKAYNEKLKEYLMPNYDKLCDTCKTRFNKNPMRIIDCKSSVCKEIVKDVPVLLDHICDDCHNHFEEVKGLLDAMGIEYNIDPYIVRGLDYYTKTVFEIIADNKNSNSTICGGGRYDGLVEQLGGPQVPACGFAVGLERFMMLLEARGIELPPENPVDLYIASMNPEANLKAAQLASQVRDEGVACLFDTVGRSLKAQMKFANKMGVLYTAVLGTDEIENGVVKVKCMADGTETELSLDNFAVNFINMSINKAVDDFNVGGDIDISALGGLL